MVGGCRPRPSPDQTAAVVVLALRGEEPSEFKSDLLARRDVVIGFIRLSALRDLA